MKTSKTTDLLVYLLFAGILVMFGILFFVFFKTGHFELQQERLSLKPDVKRVVIVSNASMVEIHKAQEDSPYLLYDRQVADNTKDEIKVEQSDGAVTLTINRQKSNRITNMGASSAKVALYLPQNSSVEVSLKLDLLKLSVKDASFGSLSVDSRLFLLSAEQCKIRHLSLKGNVGSADLKGALCDTVTAKLNVGNLTVEGLDPDQGIELKSRINLGRVDTGLPMDFGTWGIVVNDQATRACGQAATKYDLDINLANVALK